MALSFQLPDLLNLARSFHLRTNRCCHTVTTASQTWLNGLKNPSSEHVLTEQERLALRSIKGGLLAALCFPTCDAPQLRLLADFQTFLIYSTARMRRARDYAECGWLEAPLGLSGVDCLDDHVFFKYLAPQIRRLASMAPPAWQARFTESVLAFRSAQLQVVDARPNNVVPDLEVYTELRRNLTGLRMVFDLIELAEGISLTAVSDGAGEKLKIAKQSAVDIIGWSLDVVSYNVDQAQGNTYNLINVLVTHKGLSVQGALNYASSLIQQAFGSFAAAERRLLDPPKSSQPTHSRNRSLLPYLWSWTTSASSPTPPSPFIANSMGPDREDMTAGDIQSYIQALKDCIIGTLNWAYETELYFGQKGEEIRTFGWVFLSPKNRQQ